MNNNWIIGLVLAIILAVIAVVFALQNAEIIPVTFLFWDFLKPLALTILLTFAIGVMSALLFTIPGTFKRKRKISSLKKEIKSLQKEVESQSVKLTKININENIDSSDASIS